MLSRRLTYFDMRGRAEAIRLTLHAMAVEFDDHRVLTADEWNRLQPSTPFGGLPLYESAGHALYQSHAILRHLAREFGWLGVDEARDTAFDITQEFLSEAQEDLWRYAWADDYRAASSRYAGETLTPILSALQDWLTRGGRDPTFFVGETPSHVDFIAFAYLDEVDAFFPRTIAVFSALTELHARIQAIPAVSAYLNSTSRPFVFGIGSGGPKIDPRVVIPQNAQFHNPWNYPPDLPTTAGGSS